MKEQRQCQGCGAYLQSDQPDALGYLPRHILESGQGEMICQRCYRIKHYGKDQTYNNQLDTEKVILEGLDWAQGIVVILDLMDFEASIPRNILRWARKHEMIAVLNKVDLLPPRTRPGEASTWARHRLLALGIDPEIIPASSITGHGITDLLAAINRMPAQKWIVIGVTNSGKSSLISRILQHQVKAPRLLPTTSAFPGTTVALTRWDLDHGIVLSDSPGLVPKGRLTDLVCPDCAVRLIPSRQLKVGVHPINNRSALVVPGLAAVQPHAREEVVLVGFTASQVAWRRANADKIPGWLAQQCGNCRLPQWVTHDVSLEPNEDLYINGLGWVSARRRPVECTLTIPRGVEYTVRVNLIGAKD